MSTSKNKAILVGLVGKMPDVREFSNSKAARFSLATSDSYKDKEGKKVTTTEWHNIIAWGKLAEIVEKYVVKGQQLYVEGKIKYREYEKDGIKRLSVDIAADEIIMLGGKKEDNGSQGHDDFPVETNDLTF